MSYTLTSIIPTFFFFEWSDALAQIFVGQTVLCARSVVLFLFTLEIVFFDVILRLLGLSSQVCPK